MGESFWTDEASDRRVGDADGWHVALTIGGRRFNGGVRLTASTGSVRLRLPWGSGLFLLEREYTFDRDQVDEVVRGFLTGTLYIRHHMRDVPSDVGVSSLEATRLASELADLGYPVRDELKLSRRSQAAILAGIFLVDAALLVAFVAQGGRWAALVFAALFVTLVAVHRLR